MKLYFEDRDYEIAGRLVELVAEDDESDPQVGVPAARTLIEREDVDILTGAVSSAVANAVSDIAQRDGIPFVISNATSNNITREGTENIFRTSASTWMLYNTMGSYMAEQEVDNVMVVLPDYAGGHEGAADFMAGYTEAGGEVAGELYPPLGNNNYSAYMTSIRQADPSAVFAFFAGSDAARFVQQYRQFGVEAPLYGTGYMVDTDVLPAQGEAAIGIVNAYHYAADLDIPENKEFRAAFEEAYDREASVYAVQGWDAAWLIGEAITATEGNTEDTDALIKAMEDVEFESPRGPMELDENHNPVQNIYVREVRELDDGTIANVTIDTIENVRDPGKGR
jgi:branched-chain amino acid transport system substrate-binding protein